MKLPAAYCKLHRAPLTWRQIWARGCLCPKKQRGKPRCWYLKRNRGHPAWDERQRRIEARKAGKIGAAAGVILAGREQGLGVSLSIMGRGGSMYVLAKISKEEILHCPRCGEVMIQDRMGYWRCPRCSGEWWDDESKLALIRSQAAARAAEETLRRQLRWSLSKQCDVVMPLVPVIDPQSRGSRSSKRKKPLPRQLMTERYLLF